MGLFNFFNKKEKTLSENELKWNKMWELWSDGKADTPYSELMTYQSEVNNGGHLQYFDNIENTGDLQREISKLELILSQVLKDNLQEAYKAYHILKKNADDKKYEKIIEKCDKIFSDNEERINRILEEYSERIEL